VPRLHVLVRSGQNRGASIGATDALCHLSLRRCSYRDSAQASRADKLQLLDLPALRNAMGLLQGLNRSDRGGARNDRRVLVGRQEAQVRPLCEVRLHSLLATRGCSSRQLDGGEREKLRSHCARRGPYPEVGRCFHLEIPRVGRRCRRQFGRSEPVLTIAAELSNRPGYRRVHSTD
jgi:hypothetical protein